MANAHTHAQVLLDRDAKAVGRIPLHYETPPPASKEESSTDDDGKAEAKSGKPSKGLVEGISVAADGTGEASVEANEKGADTENAEAVAEAEDEEALGKAVLKAQLGQLTRLRTSSASTARYEKLADKLREEHRGHLPLLLELLAWAREAPLPADMTGPTSNDAAAAWRAERVSDAADALLAPDGPIDTASLAQYWGGCRSRKPKPLPDMTNSAPPRHTLYEPVLSLIMMIYQPPLIGRGRLTCGIDIWQECTMRRASTRPTMQKRWPRKWRPSARRFALPYSPRLKPLPPLHPSRHTSHHYPRLRRRCSRRRCVRCAFG